MASDRQDKARPARRAAWVLGALAAGFLVHQAFAAAPRRTAPAGFADGVRDGVLMPIALPWLLLGRDVTIYAADNTGRPYKLGYTAGVNGCGAVFFGLMFRRLHGLTRSGAGPR